MFGDLTDPQSQNRYVYCRNNPHKYTDPDGRAFIADDLAAALVLGTIYGAVVSTATYWKLTPKDQRNVGGAIGSFVAGGASGAAIAATGVVTASVAVVAAVSTVAAAISYPVIKGYEYAAGYDIPYDPIEHASTIIAAPISSVVTAGTGGLPNISDEVGSQVFEQGTGEVIEMTIKSSLNYDPWKEEHYMNQPLTVLQDWDYVESLRG